MNDKSQVKISRRDAIKALAAVAGATALANIPSKWIKPSLNVGILPAHAQTSVVHHTVTAGISDPTANYCNSLKSTAVITPPSSGIPLNYILTTSGSVVISSPAHTGTVATDGTGTATLAIIVDKSKPFNKGDTITITWSFKNPSDGSGSSAQVFTSAGSGCSGGHTLTPGPTQNVGYCYDTDLTSTVTISPADSGIPMKYTITPSAGVTISSPLTGTELTNSSGAASVTFIAADIGGSNTDYVTVTWEFANPSDGTGSGSQVFQSSGC